MKNLLYLAIILLAACTNQELNHDTFLELSGEYLGQKTPGDSAVLFAPGIVSSGMGDRDIAVTSDGKEIFFTRVIGNSNYFTIFHTQEINGKWQKPDVFKYCRDSRYKYTEPFVSHDGKKLLFVSDMPVKDSIISYDIWVCEKDEENNWKEPYNLGEPVNTEQNEFFPTLTIDGTIYYNHFDSEARSEFIYRSKLVEGKYTEPEKLNEKVNGGRARFNAFIAPDESFIIIPTFGLHGSFGGTDYYIVFRDQDDNWSDPINMGAQVNSEGRQEWSASISPDGKYLFYMSEKVLESAIYKSDFSASGLEKLHNSPQNGYSDIYWIKTDFIEDLRKQAKF